MQSINILAGILKLSNSSAQLVVPAHSSGPTYSFLGAETCGLWQGDVAGGTYYTTNISDQAVPLLVCDGTENSIYPATDSALITAFDPDSSGLGGSLAQVQSGLGGCFPFKVAVIGSGGLYVGTGNGVYNPTIATDNVVVVTYSNGGGFGLLINRNDGTVVAGTNLRVNGNFGVGNSASGSTPGSIVKKVEIFDNNGTSLGFLPIYDSIT